MNTITRWIIRAEGILNLLELAGVLLISVLAILMQLLFHELPCPLCLLQRAGFLCIAAGLLLNIRFGFRPSHYALIVLSGLLTSFIALRQIALHVVPGTGAYGSPFLGLHLYTWSFIIAMAVVIATTVMLGIDRQYLAHNTIAKKKPLLTTTLFLSVILVLILNIVLVFLECGLKTCPDNPVRYEWHFTLK